MSDKSEPKRVKNEEEEKLEQIEDEQIQNNQIAKINDSKIVKKKERPEDMPDNESLLSSDDEDIKHYLLNDEEKMLKSIVWNKMNEEWINEQKLKAEQQSKEKAKIVKKAVPKKTQDKTKPNRLFAEALKKNM